MPDVTPEATPGQAAYEATLPFIGDDLEGGPWPWEKLPPRHQQAWEAAAEAAGGGYRALARSIRADWQAATAENERLRAEIAGYRASCDGWRDENVRLEDELAGVRAERDDWHEGADGWEGNFHAARKDADRYRETLERVLRELRGEHEEFLDNAELADVIARALRGDGA